MKGGHDESTYIVPGDEGGASEGSLPVPGRLWGKFLIEKRLGHGGQASIFQAFDKLGPTGHVALKVPNRPLSERQIRRWMEAEAEPLLKLQHPNIIRVVDAGVINEIPYIATELVGGLPMSEYVRRSPPSLRQILGWTVQLADALDHAHRCGIVHRDVKPTNVMVTPEGKPLLIDFGVASLVSAYQPARRHDASGTHAFMAPEQARGDPEADHRVDIFALGAILKFLLTGTGPYHGTTNAFQAAYGDDVKLIADKRGPGLRRALSRVANRALAAAPDERYRNAHDMASALRGLRTRRAVFACAAALVVLAVILGLVLHDRGDESRKHGPEAGGEESVSRAGSGTSTGTEQPATEPPDTPAEKKPGPGSAALTAAVPKKAGRTPAPESPAEKTPTPPPVVEPKAVEASLEVHFMRRDQAGSSQVLVSADALPLLTGDRIRIRARLSEPLVSYVVFINSGGEVTLLYPSTPEESKPVTEINLPRDRSNWYELEAPIGTETILLLARRKGVARTDDLVAQLKALGPAPSLDGIGLLEISEKGSQLHARSGTRALSERLVKVEPGLLDLLLECVPKEWAAIRGVSFPHVTREN